MSEPLAAKVLGRASVLIDRAESLGRPPVWSGKTNMEYAAPGTAMWSQRAWKLIQELKAELEKQDA